MKQNNIIIMCLKISNSLKEKKPLNKGHIWHRTFVSCSEVLLYFEALKCRHLVLVHVDHCALYIVTWPVQVFRSL